MAGLPKKESEFDGNLGQDDREALRKLAGH